MSAEKILAELKRLDINSLDFHQCIIMAEDASPTLEQEKELRYFLKDFLALYRDGDTKDVMISVGSAIRTLIANIPIENINEIKFLTRTPDCHFLPLETQLELVKMISRKFKANPPKESNLHKEISEYVISVAESFLDPFILNISKCPAIAMNAIQASVSIRNSQCISILTKLEKLSCEWLKKQLGRRLAELKKDWQEKLPEGHSANGFIESISKIEDFKIFFPEK